VWACGSYGRDVKFIQNLSRKTLRSEDLDADGRIMLEWILQKVVPGL
jgi:hypothetical protein